MAVWGKIGVKTLDIGFATPKRHFLARNRVVWRILRQNRLKNPQKVAESLCAERRKITHAQNRNPKTDVDKILHSGRYLPGSYLNKFWWPSVKGFLVGGGSNFPLSHRLSSSPLQHSRTTVRACDWYSITHSLFHPRFKPPFSANSDHRSLFFSS